MHTVGYSTLPFPSYHIPYYDGVLEQVAIGIAIDLLQSQMNSLFHRLSAGAHKKSLRKKLSLCRLEQWALAFLEHFSRWGIDRAQLNLTRA